MPTFSNTPIPPQAPAEPSTPAVLPSSPLIETVPPAAPSHHACHMIPDDNVVIRNFRNASAEAVPKLNRDFGLSLPEDRFLRLQQVFRHTLMRDPTAGELRLLDAMEREGRGQPDREAVGELYTDSPAIAETWSDMMGKYAALWEARGAQRIKSPAPPCSFEDALALIGRYLHRTGVRLPVADGAGNTDGRTLVLSGAWQEAEALAGGYTPVARVQVGQGVRSVWVRIGEPLSTVPERGGDFLLYLRRMTPQAVTQLVSIEQQKKHPELGDIRAVAGHSLLDTVLTLCAGADLYPDRLLHKERKTPGGRVEVHVLSARPAICPDGTADYILRIPLKRMRDVTDTLRQLSADTTVIGQVRSDDQTIIYMRNRMGTKDIPAATLPTLFLRGYPAVGLHRCHAEVSGRTAPVLASVLARLPSANRREEGLTPDGYEAVALTAYEPPILAIPEAHLLLSSSAVIIHESGTGYTAAMEACASAVQPLIGKGISPADIRLSVSVVVSDSEQSLCDLTVEVTCGLYRYAAERCFPIDDPAITVQTADTGSSPSVALTVAAWAKSPAVCRRVLTETQDPWNPARHIHKEAPPLFCPILHRTEEPVLHALCRFIRSNATAAVSLLPIAMKQIEVEVETEVKKAPCPEEALAANTSSSADGTVKADNPPALCAEPPTPQTRKELHWVLDGDSVARLAERIASWATPLFAVNATDTRLLLENATIRAALEQRLEYGYAVVVLNEACSVFAEYGFLPACLGELNTYPAIGCEVTVTYSHTPKPATRVPRGSLKTPARDGDTVPALLTLTLPDGTRLPDGFVGRDGRVLGLVNGLDAATVPLLLDSDFSHYVSRL